MSIVCIFATTPPPHTHPAQGCPHQPAPPKISMASFFFIFQFFPNFNFFYFLLLCGCRRGSARSAGEGENLTNPVKVLRFSACGSVRTAHTRTKTAKPHGPSSARKCSKTFQNVPKFSQIFRAAEKKQTSSNENFARKLSKIFENFPKFSNFFQK